MEEKLLNEVENLESSIDLGVGEETTEVDENHNDYGVTSYDHYDTDSEIEDYDDEESDGNLGKVLIVGAMVASAAAGAYLAPKIKKAGTKGFNWVKSKFSKEESEEIITKDEEPEK